MPENVSDIIGLGVIAVDEILYVDSYPPADGKKFLNGRRRLGGGNTSCALAAAARLGSRCAALGRLGDDELSQFAVPYTNTDDPADACRLLAQTGQHRTVVVTAGREGCYWCSRGASAINHILAHRIEPVDTTGCGDVFHGAFCHGLVQGWEMERILRFANAAGAIKATRTGGWAAVPTPEEVQEILDGARQ